MRVALVHDSLIQHGGAEKVFLALCELYPKADVYTSIASSDWIGRINEINRSNKIYTSGLQKIPFSARLEKVLLPLYPLAFESFDFSSYDLVISSSSRFAHGIITGPNTLHVCYMNSPARFLWEGRGYWGDRGDLGEGLTSPISSVMRMWDWAASQRVDCFIANSNYTAARIRKYYGRESTVIYPFVDGVFLESRAKSLESRGSFFLVVSRLVPWKRIDLAVSACTALNLPLKIVGVGPDLGRLRKVAGISVEFLGRVSDNQLVDLYADAKALIFTQKEDFGMTAVEAMACGTPVVAYKAGGAMETVVPGKTGEFFGKQTIDSLAGVLGSFDRAKYSVENCRAQAEKFSKERFFRGISRFVEEKYEKSARSSKKGD